LASYLAARRSSAVGYRDYSRCLPDYLTRLSDEARLKRDRALSKLENRAAIQARQAWAREAFQKLIGKFPAKTPLNLQVTGEFARDAYRVKKLRYESRPQFFVTANLYVPNGEGPFPGVLFQMGHAPEGKAYGSYQRACQSLARLGFVVLAFNPAGQGERVYYSRRDSKSTRLASVDEEHSLPGTPATIASSSNNQILVNVPAMPNGNCVVTVTGPGGRVSNGIPFTVLANKLIPVTFTVRNAARTSIGDYIFLTGDTVELGNWSTTYDGAVGPMLTPNFPDWFLNVSVPAGRTLKFKFIKIAADNTVTWENGPNHTFTVPASGTASVGVDWQN
jgi:hypothetical protein